MNVFITGASSGIGAALAAEYARRGATLGLVARRAEVLAQLAATLPGAHHRYAIDVTDKDALIAASEDGTVVSRSYTGKTCRVLRNDWTNEWDAHPERLKPFPQQAIESMQQGANHLGDDENTIVDVRREFMPAGQGVGAIDSLIDAGDLVRQFVAEAHDALRSLD